MPNTPLVKGTEVKCNTSFHTELLILWESALLASMHRKGYSGSNNIYHTYR